MRTVKILADEPLSRTTPENQGATAVTVSELWWFDFEMHDDLLRSSKGQLAMGGFFNRYMHTNFLNTSLSSDSVRFLLFLKGAECLPAKVLGNFKRAIWSSVTKLGEVFSNISEHQSRMDFCEISQC
jgi:hypothetical protein